MKPESGTKWIHSNGNVYVVLLLANEKSERPEYPITVVYQGENGNIWARPLSDWDRSFKPAPKDPPNYTFLPEN